MKGKPIVIAVGFVLTFALGLLVGRSAPFPPTQPPNADLHTAVVDGLTIQYDPSSALSIEIDDSTSVSGPRSSLQREGSAVGPALETNSETVGSSFEAGSPSVGSVSGGSVLSTIEAAASTPFSSLYLIGALCLVGGGVAAFGFKMPGLGLGLALGGLAVCAVAWFASSDQRMLWLLVPLAGAGILYWLYQAGLLRKWQSATVPITKGIAALEKLDPGAYAAATSAISTQAPKGTRKRKIVDDVVIKSLNT